MPASTTPTKIIQIVPRDGWGGVESAARSAGEALNRTCNFVVMFLAGRTLAKNPRHIIDHPDRKLNSPGTYFRAVTEILRERPDVLVCSLWRSVLLGFVIKLVRWRTRYVCFLHNTVPAHFADDVLHRIALTIADEIWADSEATLVSRCPDSAKPKRVISFVTSHHTPVSWPVLAPRFVNWSRLHPQKGHDRAVRLISALVRRGVDAQLEIWGADNGEGTALKKLISELGLERRIQMPGPVDPDMIPMLASKHAFFLQLSRHEGMAMAVVEAMQFGLVPVVTPVGQMAEYVRHNRTGILVDPENLELAAEQLLGVLENEDRFGAMSEAAASIWNSSPLYADDVCNAALELVHSRGGS